MKIPVSRRMLGRAIRIGVSVGMLWLLLRYAGLDATLAELGKLQPSWLLLALGLLLAEVLVRAFNWRQLCHAAQCRMSIADALYAYFAGSFFGAFLPSTLGTDAVRSALAASRTGGKIEVLLATTVSLNLLSLGALSLLGMLASGYELARGAGENSVVLLSFLTSVGCVCGVLLFVVLAHWQKGRDKMHFGSEPTGWVTRLMHVGDRFISALLTIHSWAAIGRALLVAALSALFRLAVILVLLQGAGVHINVVALFIAGPLLVLAAALPISIAGFGGQQGVAVYVLGGLGVPIESAFATSLVYSALYIVVNAIGAVAYALGRSSQQIATPR